MDSFATESCRLADRLATESGQRRCGLGSKYGALFSYHTKCGIRGSARYVVWEVRSVRERERGGERERERERERDRSDVTLVALKLAISLHFSLPKKLHLGSSPLKWR